MAHDPVPLLLGHAAVEGLGPVPAAVQRLGQLVDLVAGAAEDQRGGGRLHVEQAAQGGHALGARDDVGGLADLGGRPLRRGLALDADLDGVAQVGRGDGADARRHGRGEQRGAVAGRGGRQDLLEVLLEAHVEHLVGLVQHQGRQPVEVQRAPAQVVQGAAGGGDDDVDAAAQGADLLVHAGAAVHRQDADVAGLAVAVHGLGDLHGQLAGGDQDQRGHPVAQVGVGVQRLQQRQREGGGLARPGGRLPEQVAALQQRRDGLALDGGRLLVAQGVEGVDELLDQAQGGEAVLGDRVVQDVGGGGRGGVTHVRWDPLSKGGGRRHLPRRAHR